MQDVSMLCVYCMYNYVNKFETRSSLLTSHLTIFLRNRKHIETPTTSSTYSQTYACLEGESQTYDL